MKNDLMLAEPGPAAGRKSSPSPLPKRKGELAELAFALKAVELGFSVSKPYGDSESFDFILGERGRLIRIQVKSAFTSADSWGYAINLVHNQSTAHYSPDEVDFIVAYVAPFDAWYIIPIAQVHGSNSIRLYPRGNRRGGGLNLEKYREAWHQLRHQNPIEQPPSPDPDE
jgi:hypothetical protein